MQLENALFGNLSWKSRLEQALASYLRRPDRVEALVEHAASGQPYFSETGAAQVVLDVCRSKVPLNY